MAVGTAATSPAVGAGRRKDVGDILHCMLLRSVERERQAAIATPVSPTRRQQFDHLLIKVHAENVIAIRLPAERRPSRSAGQQTDNQVWQVLAADTIGRKAYDFRLARDVAGGRQGSRSKPPTRAPGRAVRGHSRAFVVWRGRRLPGGFEAADAATAPHRDAGHGAIKLQLDSPSRRVGAVLQPVAYWNILGRRSCALHGADIQTETPPRYLAEFPIHPPGDTLPAHARRPSPHPRQPRPGPDPLGNRGRRAARIGCFTDAAGCVILTPEFRRMTRSCWKRRLKPKPSDARRRVRGWLA